MSDPFVRMAEALDSDIQGDVLGGGDFWILDDDEFLVTKEPSDEGGIYTVHALSGSDEAQEEFSQKLKMQDVDMIVEYLGNETE